MRGEFEPLRLADWHDSHIGPQRNAQAIARQHRSGMRKGIGFPITPAHDPPLDAVSTGHQIVERGMAGKDIAQQRLGRFAQQHERGTRMVHRIGGIGGHGDPARSQSADRSRSGYAAPANMHRYPVHYPPAWPGHDGFEPDGPSRSNIMANPASGPLPRFRRNCGRDAYFSAIIPAIVASAPRSQVFSYFSVAAS